MAALSPAAVAVFASQFLSALLIANAVPHGFSVDLIHRDSPGSPFHNPNETPQERLINAYRRSISRAQSVGPNALASPYADIVPYYDEYLMRIQIGTPPVEILGIADTGSDLIWTQCLPCTHCYEQDAPKFNPTASSTYKDAPCGSSQCQNVYKVNCESYDGSCPYEQFYGDGSSFTIGNVGIDTITLRSTSGQPVVLPEAIIGCGHNNSGFGSTDSGIVGLGWGASSLVSQMGDAIQGLFSYCFGSIYVNKTSKINFGANAIVSGDGTVSTTLFRKQTHPNKYYLNLEAIGVNGTRIETSGTQFHATDGNIIIDSGSMFTFLPRDFYSRVEAAVASVTRNERADFPSDFVKLCYKSTNLEDFPIITLHFSGADLVLGRLNTYVNVAPGISCLVLAYSDVLPPIVGNRALQNFLVGYDTFSEKVSFKPTDCSALWS